MKKTFYGIFSFVILSISVYAGDDALAGDSQVVEIKYYVQDNFSKWDKEEEIIRNGDATVGNLTDYLSERFKVAPENMDISDATGIVAKSDQKLKYLTKPDGTYRPQDEGKLILTITLWEPERDSATSIYDRIGRQYKVLDELASEYKNGKRILGLARKIVTFTSETTEAVIQGKQKELRELLDQQTVPTMAFHLHRLMKLLNMRPPINLLGLP